VMRYQAALRPDRPAAARSAAGIGERAYMRRINRKQALKALFIACAKAA
jgi:hypothetical protein